MARDLEACGKVKWDTPQGQATGKVVKKETGTTKAGGPHRLALFGGDPVVPLCHSAAQARNS